MGFASGGLSAAQILAALSADGSKLNRFPSLSFIPTEGDVGFDALVGTWVVASVPSSVWTGANVNNLASSTQNDEIRVGMFFVPVSGDYTVYFICAVDTSCAKAHFMLNGVDVANIDTYDPSRSSNNLLSVSLATLTAGLKIVGIRAATKHASSSSYTLEIQAILIIRDV